MPVTRSGPLTVALVDDYDVVLSGLANMLKPYGDRVRIVELDANEPVDDDVDIVLYDSFAQPESDHEEISVLVANSRARRVVVYTCNFHSELVDAASELGVDGYLSKTLPAGELVTALEKVHAGETVVSQPPARSRPPSGLDWPGRSEGLTERESEILAADHSRHEQRGGGRADLPQAQHRHVLHPKYLPKDRRNQPHPGGALRRATRFRARPDRLQPWQTNP